MEYEKLNYPEALEKLASTYNFSLGYTDKKQARPHSNLMEKVNEWYQKLLLGNKTALIISKSAASTRAVSKNSA